MTLSTCARSSRSSIPAVTDGTISARPRPWRIQISKLASTSLPRILADTTAIAGHAAPDATGAAWKLQMRERDLDSNIIALAPGSTIDAHNGPDLDVLIHVLGGSGQLATELGTLHLQAGALVGFPAAHGASSPPARTA